MPTRTNYESTFAPPSLTYSVGNLGRRSDEVTLGNAYDTPSGDAGASRTTENQQTTLLNLAKATMGTYNGENDMFPQYRRNFIPSGGSLTEEYVDVRDKNTVTVGVGTGLGSQYSPTIASPGAAAGINPTALASVSSSINGAVIDVLDNPSNVAHQNIDSVGGVTTGTVRRFTLGVGSGGGSTGTPTVAGARGQFPRPLT